MFEPDDFMYDANGIYEYDTLFYYDGPLFYGQYDTRRNDGVIKVRLAALYAFGEDIMDAFIICYTTKKHWDLLKDNQITMENFFRTACYDFMFEDCSEERIIRPLTAAEIAGDAFWPETGCYLNGDKCS
jgi:hypothetical protein